MNNLEPLPDCKWYGECCFYHKQWRLLETIEEDDNIISALYGRLDLWTGLKGHSLDGKYSVFFEVVQVHREALLKKLLNVIKGVSTEVLDHGGRYFCASKMFWGLEIHTCTMWLLFN